MSTHGILTEPSLSPHDRKGREGKGIGRDLAERACMPSHHASLADLATQPHTTMHGERSPR